MTLGALFRRLPREVYRGELLVRNRYVLLADVVLCAASLYFAFALRFDLGFLAVHPEFFFLLIVALAIKTPVFFAFGLYRRFWRYASLNDMLVVGLVVSTASVVLGVTAGVAKSFGLITGVSRAVLLIDWLLTLVTIGAVRAAVRILGESRARMRVYGQGRASSEKPDQKRVLIVGAGEAGAMVVREMQRNPQLDMTVVGFLDDDRRKQGHRIYGTLVMGPTSAVERIAKVARAEEVIIAMPRASGAAVRAVAERCRKLDIPCRTIPGVFELLDGQISVNRLRNVEIADLLRRRQIATRSDSSSYVSGKTVLVTGAGGSIGSELCRQVAHARPASLVMLGHGENSLFEVHAKLREAFPQVPLHVVVADIRDQRRIESVFAEYQPGIVFHAAAHKHVHLMEANFAEAITNNVLGTQNMVEAAVQARTERFVSISTDKAVSPICIMGASKRMAEAIVRRAGRRADRPFVVVRFGNVLGSRGSVVPYFTDQIARGGPVTITHPDMKRFFMTIGEAVHLVLEAGGMGNAGDLFVLNMGEPVKIMDLARDLIRLSGFTLEQVRIELTGMRPGEKLEEALWEDDERVEPTRNSDILRLTKASSVHGNLPEALRALERAVQAHDRLAVEMILCEWIPTFSPPLPAGHAELSRGSHGSGRTP